MYLFVERLLKASWGSLGGPGVPKILVNMSYIKTHVFKTVCSLYLTSLGALPEAILAHIGPIWAPKWGPKSIRNWSNELSILVYFSSLFWDHFGIHFGGSASAKKGDQKCDQFRNLLSPGLGGPAIIKTEKRRQVKKGRLLEIWPRITIPGFKRARGGHVRY